MVVCKYFLQGTCRFGENCKFEHQINDHSYAGNSSILVQNYAPKPTSNVDTNTLVKAVVNDMTMAEKGAQWLFSSYAPFKEKPAFPGFEDHSMEEVRYLFYESVKNGTVEQFKQTLQLMFQQAMMKIKALQSPSPEAVNILKTIYETPPSSQNAGPTSMIFGGSQPSTSSNPIFGPSQPTTSSNSVFGGPQPQNTIFGSTSPNKTVFGASNPSQQNIFGGGTTNSMFGTQPVQNKSMFGGGMQQTSTNKSIFDQVGQNKSIFAQPPPQQPAASNPIFGRPSVFGGPQQTVFPQQQQQNPQFLTVTPQQNQFAAPTSNPFTASQNQANKPSSQHTQSIFGNMGAAASNMFGVTTQKPNEEFYSKLEDLTEAEIKWFQSDDLDIMGIPEKPPTYEMCFKVQ